MDRGVGWRRRGIGLSPRARGASAGCSQTQSNLLGYSGSPAGGAHDGGELPEGVCGIDFEG
jgi:hypothetical protein